MNKIKQEQKGNNTPLKSLIKNSGNEKKSQKSTKKVEWDVEALASQEKERKLNPKMKIDEPKTPYIPFEDPDDEYLTKLNQTFKIKPTKEILDSAINKLKTNPIRKESSSFSDEFIEVEVIESDGTKKKELVKKDHQNSKDFLKKRKLAYENEYIQAKAKSTENNSSEEENDLFSESSSDEKDIIEQTIKNTIINKFSGKVNEKKIEKLVKEEEIKNSSNQKKAHNTNKKDKIKKKEKKTKKNL